jgi:hypothetical protein
MVPWHSLFVACLIIVGGDTSQPIGLCIKFSRMLLP